MSLRRYWPVLCAAVLLAPPAHGAQAPYTLTATTDGSPVPLVAGGWEGDGRQAELDLDLASVSPSARTRFVATWTSSVARAPRGFSTAATAFVVERAPTGSPDRVTAAPVLSGLTLESRQRVGAGGWSRWEAETVRSYSDLSRTEYVGVGFADCIDVPRPTAYRVQYRLTGSKGGTDASGLTLQVRLGGTDCA